MFKLYLRTTVFSVNTLMNVLIKEVCMSVGVIKSELTRFQSELQNCITRCDNLIHTLNGVVTATSNTVASPVKTLKMSIDKQGSLLNILSQHCRAELHIFFREYNASLSNLKKSNERVKSEIEELEETANELYLLYLIDCSMDGFLEYDLSEQDLKAFTPEIVRYKNELFKLQFETQKRNRDLIVKVR